MVASIIDVASLKERVDLRAIAPMLGVTLFKKTSRENAGPCPRCGGHDRLVVQAQRWQCRKCHAWDDAPAFVSHVTGETFPQSLQTLALLAGKPARTPLPARKKADSLRRQSRGYQSLAWQEWAAASMKGARDDLRGRSAVGSAIAAYLESRGIERATWSAFGLGALDHAYYGQVLTLPYCNRSAVEAVQYRVIGAEKKRNRYRQAKGSNPSALFGLHMIRPAHHRLLIACEGELNAASIWQVVQLLNAPIDVVSFGGESAHWQGMIELAPQYGAVVAWADREDIANQVGAALDYARGGALVLRSPDGVDANDLLRNEQLEGFTTVLIESLYERLSALIAASYENAREELRTVLVARHERLDVLGMVL